MNKKGQIGFGLIMVAFIAIITGVILFQVIAQQVGETINTVAVANESLSTVASDTVQYMTNYRALSGVVIYNETNDIIIGSGNYTVTNNVIHPTTGNLCVSILPGTINANYTSAWQVSGTGQPLTYIPDSGARAMASLIVIFFALLVAVIALEPTLRSGVLDLMGK